MHDIEPHYHWRELYQSERDQDSPFYSRVYSEFTFTNKVYNYYIHPQWDDFGSQTLYGKQLWGDYDAGTAIIELIGEWNDTLYNDVKFFKENVIDPLLEAGVSKFVVLCENVLNFHGDDNCYYEEWVEEARENDGWVAFINTLPHVVDELNQSMVDHYVFYGDRLNDIPWRPKKPRDLIRYVEGMLEASSMRIG